MAVFSGMVGVTVFGVFLTPLFNYAIQSFNDRQEKKRHSTGRGDSLRPPSQG